MSAEVRECGSELIIHSHSDAPTHQRTNALLPRRSPAGASQGRMPAEISRCPPADPARRRFRPATGRRCSAAPARRGWPGRRAPAVRGAAPAGRRGGSGGFGVVREVGGKLVVAAGRARGGRAARERSRGRRCDAPTRRTRAARAACAACGRRASSTSCSTSSTASASRSMSVANGRSSASACASSASSAARSPACARSTSQAVPRASSAEAGIGGAAGQAAAPAFVQQLDGVQQPRVRRGGARAQRRQPQPEGGVDQDRR